MSTKSKVTGLALAAAAAALFAAAPSMAGDLQLAAEEGKVKCAGINSCKGTSECASATNSCKGQNSCAGQGWLYSESEEACSEAGGEVVTG